MRRLCRCKKSKYLYANWANQLPSSVRYGLYQVDSVKSIPLTDVSFKIDIKDALSTVEITQVYINNNNNPVECEYKFPVDPISMAVTSLTIMIDDEVIEGKIMDKEKADEKYSDAIARGNTAFKMNNKDLQPDIIQMNVGNLLPEQKAKVMIKYAKLLDIEDNSWSFRIPLTYTPSYIQKSSSKGHSRGPNKKSLQVSGGRLSYKWNMSMTIQSSKKITRLVCLSHAIDTTFKQNNRVAEINLVDQDEVHDHDLIFLYRTEAFEEPSVVIQKCPEFDKYAALISFYPSFLGEVEESSKTIDTDSSKSYIKASEEVVTGSGEYVFLLDCSGSMSGNRIKLAVIALEAFLRSLPVDSRFNIVCFGSTHKSFSNESVEYNSENLNNALKFAKKSGATLGGTEIDAALESVVSKECKEGYPRNIFLLTDGAVYHPDTTIDLVKKHSFNTRVHTFGIGSGASRHLVKGCAIAGNGTFQFITKNSEITSCVIQSLAKAAVPAFAKPTVVWPSDVNVMLQGPPNNRIPNVYMNEPFIVTAIIDKPVKEGKVSLEFKRTIDHKEVKLQVALPNTTIEGKDIYQIAVKSAFENDVDMTEEKMKELSVNYSVLSKVTAFMAVKKNKTKIDAPMLHIDIPSAGGEKAIKKKGSLTRVRYFFV